MRTEHLLALMIPIIAIVLGIGTGCLGMYLSYRKRKEVFAFYHQERMAAIDKGVDLPPLPDALLTDDARPYNPRRHLLKGLAWLFIGLGLGAGVYAAIDFRWALFSLVPIGVGLAHLIYYAVEGKKEIEMLGHQEAASGTAS